MTTKPVFRLIVAGSRDFNNYELLKQKCDTLLSQKRLTHSIVIISGTARGADRLGERYAAEHGYRIERFPADWDRDGIAAGPIRNSQMAAHADALVAFWDGQSRGTKDMIERAEKHNLPIRVVRFQI